MSNPIDRILKAHQEPAAEPPPDDGSYRSFRVNRTQPGFGFEINRANGEVDGFLFHTIDNMQLRMVGGAEYLSFTHRGKAVTIAGHQLKPIHTAIIRHLLVEINEPDGRPAEEGMPAITRMEITDASGLAPPRVQLVKQG